MDDTMITLYMFPRLFGLPNPSPPCMKAEILLKMADLAYRPDTTGFAKAPKGKLPYINDDGVLIADSTFIRWHIEQKYGIDFDNGLTPSERAQAWAFEKLCEDSLYFNVVHSRWMNDANFARGPAQFFDEVPLPLRALVRIVTRRGVRRTLHGQGISRHSDEEVARLAARGIDALADQLGSKPWLMGSDPCSADASVVSTVTSLLCALFEGPLLGATQKHANLVAYRDRAISRWYPDLKVA
jgi:glutathione S-transferase